MRMLIIEFLALFCSGTFFGAAVYISIAQHPAAVKAGVDVATRFFPPMYRRAAPMQIVSAVVGTSSGLIVWYSSDDLLWLVGALLLISVVPYTLVVLKPINDRLLDPEPHETDSNMADLLDQWATRHWLRTVASGLSFVVYLWVSLGS